MLVPAAGSGGRPPPFLKSKRNLGAREKEVSMEPKRQNEIKLHMDKVSAFTVPTLNIAASTPFPGDAVNALDEEDTDIVHWKAMDCTVEKVGDRMGFNKGSKKDSRGIGAASGTGAGIEVGSGKRIDEESEWSNNEDTPRGAYSEKTGRSMSGYPSMLRERSRDVSRRFSRLHLEMLKESSNLRVAVKDFEVRASYTFWMDVTVKEANKMYVHRDKVSKDLVCSFLLDLPELCLDITSSQFYIGINVIKNVLLAQPPAMAASIRDNISAGDSMEDQGGEQTSSKITEIFRDSQHTPPDLKALQELNLKNRQSREEVKTLIEDYFNRVVEVKYGMARVVDLFIGKGTWILRSSPTAVNSPSQSQEKVPTMSPTYLSNLGIGRLHSQSAIKTSVERDKDKEKDAGELLETGFTGVHATFTYNEDRYVIKYDCIGIRTSTVDVIQPCKMQSYAILLYSTLHYTIHIHIYALLYYSVLSCTILNSFFLFI